MLPLIVMVVAATVHSIEFVTDIAVAYEIGAEQVVNFVVELIGCSAKAEKKIALSFVWNSLLLGVTHVNYHVQSAASSFGNLLNLIGFADLFLSDLFSEKREPHISCNKLFEKYSALTRNGAENKHGISGSGSLFCIEDIFALSCLSLSRLSIRSASSILEINLYTLN